VTVCIAFDFLLFDRSELLQSESNYNYLDITGRWEQIEINGWLTGLFYLPGTGNPPKFQMRRHSDISK